MKNWKKPILILLNQEQIQSANLQTMAVFEELQYTLQNTCTFNEADCTTFDGSVFTYDFMNGGYAGSVVGYQQYGTLSTCVAGLQCS